MQDNEAVRELERLIAEKQAELQRLEDELTRQQQANKRAMNALAEAVLKQPQPLRVKPKGETYFSMSQVDLSLHGDTHSMVVGSTPVVNVPRTAAPYWAEADCNNVEAPTGEMIDFVPDVSAVEPSMGQLMQAQAEEEQSDGT
jgi:hypothetical protein